MDIYDKGTRLGVLVHKPSGVWFDPNQCREKYLRKIQWQVVVREKAREA